MLSLWARVDMGTMAGKEYSAFPKATALLKLTIGLISVIVRTLVEGGVLLFCRDTAVIFYSPSRLGKVKVCLTFPEK